MEAALRLATDADLHPALHLPQSVLSKFDTALTIHP
jgi:hypothetical protein